MPGEPPQAEFLRRISTLNLYGALFADSQRKTNTGLLESEQLPLDVEAPTITAERTVRRNHAVAWDDKGDRIPVVGHADGTAGLRMADRSGDVAVTARLAVRNIEKRAPACELEAGSAKIERYRKRATLSREVLLEF